MVLSILISEDKECQLGSGIASTRRQKQMWIVRHELKQVAPGVQTQLGESSVFVRYRCTKPDTQIGSDFFV